ncbi:T9SS type A sorting domain-containing protein [Hymenobacter antarcticus]|uniref:Por secretion system C-terminal sorting domain-containing protein n=1 Tax=Hymenobacter antarcticus TaxID=486270 RepID=A0ABP7Q7M9_9BACT
MKAFSSRFPMGLLALLFLTLHRPAAAQAPAWQSARAVAVATAAVMRNNSTVTATAVDAAGNVYLAGEFTNTVVLGGTTLTSLGLNDVFVAKFNPASNQFVWAQRAGGTNDDRATALAVSGTSVYVAGHFYSLTVGFGTTTLTNANSNGSFEVFVAKLTDAGSTGSFVWAQRAGGTETDFATALVVSGTSVYVAGFFDSPTAGFGPATLTSAGSYDVFVAKLTDAGSTASFGWAQRAGGTGNDGTFALAVSGTSVYVAGYFQSLTVGFGATTLTNTNANGSNDVYVAKLTDAGSTGSFGWAQRAGGTGSETALALAVSGPSVYVAGSFTSATAGFGPATLTNAGSQDIFVAKLADAGPTGSFTWAQRAGGTGNDLAGALAVSGTSVYVAGYFSNVAGFGATTLTSAGSRVGIRDVFVAKLADAGSTGSFGWAQRAGGTSDDEANALSLSGTSVYVAGYFGSATASFSSITLSNPTLNASTLGFLASLTDATLTATTASRAPAALFPNPARRTATLRLPAGTAPAPLTLTDARGRAVRRYPAPAGSEAALDLRGLPAGLYLLRGAGPAQRLLVE